jgi:anti-anti-sigma factor
LGDSEGRSLIWLQGEIDIATSVELKTALMEALSSPKEILVDVEGATDLDVTAVQLLWAAAREAEKTGTAFAFSSQVAETVSRVVREMGFADFGPLPAVSSL